MKRRTFLSSAGAAAASLALRSATSALCSPLLAEPAPAADYTLRIHSIDLEIAPGVKISTVAYNGQVPGPMLRFKEGVPVRIDVFNETPVPEVVHWHGLHIDSYDDGATEEGSPLIPSHGRLTYRFTPNPSGTRWYHTHISAMSDLTRATYTGQFGFIYIEPKYDSGSYDREVFLAIHHWEPFWTRMPPPMNARTVSYKYATFNDKTLAAAEPIRVRSGERVMFRILNASATRNVSLALPGHLFTVVGMDGNPVPQPRQVETIALGVAERIDAIVEMDSVGIWILGSTEAEERQQGLGRVIEYAGATGAPTWVDPAMVRWNYLDFANPTKQTAHTDEVPMIIAPVPADKEGFDRWTLNGKSFPDTPVIPVKKGGRYRLSFVNSSAESHPLHLHRHSFEVVSIGSKSCSGLMKDVVTINPYSSLNFDFVADNPGKTLFHCHQQLHMDYGFMQLIDYV